MIALDLSRLLSRAGSATPTGIDQVELAYAQHLLNAHTDHCLAAGDALGGIGLLSPAAAQDFVSQLARSWREGATAGEPRSLRPLARRLRREARFGGRRLRATMGDARKPPVYLLVSHQNLDRARPIAWLKRATGARFVCLIHDLIPLDFPHLTRPRQVERHRNRIATAARLADAIIVNSHATAAALHPRLGERPIALAVAPLGIDLPDTPITPAPKQPYFIAVGTIEARKNQALLLDAWQRLAGKPGEPPPRLILVGKRGFDGANMVRRLPASGGVVELQGDLPGAALARLVRGARALLFPSLAEGFGLPVAEALALGVPVLCSDLPVLRESGGGVPDYLDPKDCRAWENAICDYLADTPRRQAQLARLAAWQPPSWAAHFAIVENLIASLD